MEQELLKVFLHFDHQPINIKIFDLHSLQGKCLSYKILLMFHTKLKFHYRILLH
jgi:hypothetical protein